MPETAAKQIPQPGGVNQTDAASVQAGDVVRHLTHELRQPLSTIESIAFYLRMVLPEESKAAPQLEKLHDLVEQINWVLSDAVHLLQAAPVNRQVADLRELIVRALADRPSTAAEPLQLEFQDEPVLVSLDASQALHLIRGVVLVLRQMVRGGSKIIVRARVERQEVNLEFLVPALDMQQGELDRLFEPFASGLASGPGLSLATARRIAESHGGRMNARSEVGRGTLLRGAFPLAG